MNENKFVDIPGTLHSTAKGNIALNSDEVFDKLKNKKQQEINAEFEHYADTIHQENEELKDALENINPDQTEAIALSAKVNTIDNSLSEINVNRLVNRGTPFDTKNQARLAVINDFRKLELKITYLLKVDENNSTLITEQFIGNDVANWNDANNWKIVGPVRVSQNSQTRHTEINIGGIAHPVASVEEINLLNGELGNVVEFKGEKLNSSNYFRFPFVVGQKYKVKNLNADYISIYLRETPDGSNTQIIGTNVASGATIEFIVESASSYIGGYVSTVQYYIAVQSIDNCIVRENQLKESLDTITDDYNGRIKDIYKDLFVNALDNIDWELGTIDSQSGIPQPNNARARITTFIPIGNFNNLLCDSNYQVNLFLYDKNESYLSTTGFQDSIDVYAFIQLHADAKKLKVVLRKRDNTNIDLSTDITLSNVELQGEIYERTQETDQIKKDINNIQEKINNAKSMHHSRMMFGAHRGVEWYAPENSVAAYEMAGKQGWDYAWIAQVQWSADGTFYVLHDVTLDRTTTGTGLITEKTDEYINSLTCKVPDNLLNPAYSLNDFTTEELRIPTLERVLQIVLRYGMKICLRLESFAGHLDSKWTALKALLDSYRINGEQLIISTSNDYKDKVAFDLFGEDIEISEYLGDTATPQELIDFFELIEQRHEITIKNKSAILQNTVIDLNGVKLLHSNNIKVYVCTKSYVNLDKQRIEQLAEWGVDIFQNGRDYYI